MVKAILELPSMPPDCFCCVLSCKKEYDGNEEEADILLNISNRLAAYEDSGLSPEEVQKLAKEKARVESATHYVYAIDEAAKEILDLMEAKEEGRFIVLSLKKQKNVRNAT